MLETKITNEQIATSHRDNILKLHVLYLEKLEQLSEKEREAYEMYLNHLAKPICVVDTESFNMEMKI